MRWVGADSRGWEGRDGDEFGWDGIGNWDGRGEVECGDEIEHIEVLRKEEEPRQRETMLNWMFLMLKESLECSSTSSKFVVSCGLCR